MRRRSARDLASTPVEFGACRRGVLPHEQPCCGSARTSWRWLCLLCSPHLHQTPGALHDDA